MDNILILALLVCIVSPQNYVIMGPSYTSCAGMTVLDYYIDSSSNLYTLVADNTGFQMARLNSDASQSILTPKFPSFTDLLDVKNPYNPYIADLLLNTYLLIVYKPSQNISQLGGVRILLNLSSCQGATPPMATTYSKNETYFYRANLIPFALTSVSSYYYVDELGNEYLATITDPSNQIVKSTYNLTTATATTYAGFSSLQLYGTDNTLIIADNYQKTIAIVTAAANGTISRKQYSLGVAVYYISFALTESLAIISLTNGSVLIATTNPFSIQSSYTTTVADQQFSFYDPVSNSYIMLNGIGSSQVCFNQLDLITANVTPANCFPSGFVQYLSNNSYAIVFDTNVVLFSISNCTLSNYMSVTNNFCTACAAGCQFCTSLDNCTTCIGNYNMLNNFCCQNGQTLNTSASVKTCVPCVSNCASCNNTLTCLACNTNYSINANGTCTAVAAPTNTSNASSTTGTSNTSSASNTTNANTSNTATSNSSTPSNVTPAANSTTTNNTSSPSSPSNTSIPSNTSSPSNTNNTTNPSNPSNTSKPINGSTTTTNSSGSVTPSNSGTIVPNSSGTIAPNSNTMPSTTNNSNSNPTSNNNTNNTTPNSTQSSNLTPLQSIQGLFENLIAMANKVPSVRAILQFLFSSMVNFDDLYLYYYHERNYGNATITFLQKIRTLQNDKWQAVSTFLGGYFETIGNIQQYISNNLDFYFGYSSQKFIDIQGNGEGLLINSWNFITTNLFASALIFLTFKILFWLTFNYKISKLFRPYSFVLYFIYFILEGNTQALVFYTSSNFKLSFSSNIINKLILSVSYVFGYFFLVFCICGYIFLYNSLKKFLKYFLQNISKFQQMVIFLTITLGIKNLLFGFVHCYFRRLQQANIQFSLLLAIEFGCLVCYIFYLSKDYFEFKIKVWLIVIMQLMRIIFIFLLLLQQHSQHSSEMLQLCQLFLSPLLNLYSKLTYISIFLNFVLLFFQSLSQLVRFLRKQNQPNCEEKRPLHGLKGQQKRRKLIDMIRIEYLTDNSRVEPKRPKMKSKSQHTIKNSKLKSQYALKLKTTEGKHPTRVMVVKKTEMRKPRLHLS